MPIRTELTRIFGIEQPIVLAPMGAVAGGELAAAVSEAGGLGLIGGGYGDPVWLQRELETVVSKTCRAWGVGLITWKATDELIALALRYRPHAVFLSFGDPRPFVGSIKSAGCLLICQVQDVEEARRAKAAGADVIVAQGTEAGGHGATRSTLPLVPAVVDAVAPIPVVAAGGIADGRGLAAAIALGAAGALIGTRFCATAEALMHPYAKAKLLTASGGDTVRTRVFDVVRDYDWPVPYTGRALRNRFVDRWQGREESLRAATEERISYASAQQEGDLDTALVWAGEAVDLISSIEPAGAVVRRLGRDAEQQIRDNARRLAPTHDE